MSEQDWSGMIEAGDGSAGADTGSSFTVSEVGTIGTTPVLPTESDKGAEIGEELPLIVVRLCGDLQQKQICLLKLLIKNL